MTLDKFFEENRKIAIALSGGVDSILLMHMAKKYGCDVGAYFAKTEFQPDFELEDARKAAEAIDVSVCVMKFSAFEDERVAENGKDRCYFCKRGMMQIIKAMSQSDGYDVLCDGTNASDDAEDRAGFRVLGELGIISPLRICGMTKADVRALARKEGLFVWDKPSYACLATRIKSGERITREKIAAASLAEDFLRGLGFSDFRVRNSGNTATVEIRKADAKLWDENSEAIGKELGKYYSSFCCDTEVRDAKLSD